MFLLHFQVFPFLGNFLYLSHSLSLYYWWRIKGMQCGTAITGIGLLDGCFPSRRIQPVVKTQWSQCREECISSVVSHHYAVSLQSTIFERLVPTSEALAGFYGQRSQTRISSKIIIKHLLALKQTQLQTHMYTHHTEADIRSHTHTQHTALATR